MRVLEFLEWLSKFLHEIAGRYGLPSLDVIAFRLMLFVALCVAGLYLCGLVFKMLSKIYPSDPAPKINFVAVIVGSLVSYVVWIAAFWFTRFLFMIIFTGTPLDSSASFIWISLGCACIVNLIAIGCIGALVREGARFFPHGHACAVGLLFIGFDLLLARPISSQLSFGEAMTLYIVTLCVACLSDVLLVGLFVLRDYFFPTAWASRSLFVTVETSPEPEKVTDVTNANPATQARDSYAPINAETFDALLNISPASQEHNSGRLNMAQPIKRPYPPYARHRFEAGEEGPALDYEAEQKEARDQRRWQEAFQRQQEQIKRMQEMQTQYYVRNNGLSKESNQSELTVAGAVFWIVVASIVAPSLYMWSEGLGTVPIVIIVIGVSLLIGLGLFCWK